MDHDSEFETVPPCLARIGRPLPAQIADCSAHRITLMGSQPPVRQGESPLESPERLSARQVMADAAVQMAVQMTALMFGLPDATVTEIVAVELPMIAAMSEGNLELRRRLYVASRARLPERIEDFYARMIASPPVRQAVMDDYKATYGAMLDAVNRLAARKAGTTDGQARDVMAATLPAVTQVLGTINVAGDEQGFCQRLRDLHV